MPPSEPQGCKKCSPVHHYHADHSYQSYVDDDDSGNEIVVHVYSCRICLCSTRMEGGGLEAFKGMVIHETGVRM